MRLILISLLAALALSPFVFSSPRDEDLSYLARSTLNVAAEAQESFKEEEGSWAQSLRELSNHSPTIKDMLSVSDQLHMSVRGKNNSYLIQIRYPEGEHLSHFWISSVGDEIVRGCWGGVGCVRGEWVM